MPIFNADPHSENRSDYVSDDITSYKNHSLSFYLTIHSIMLCFMLVCCAILYGIVLCNVMLYWDCTIS